ncbi:hypothetical protein TNCV_4420301 [Trichonephila clavipes]|nr:hypothetical protein TNCV_4420301 [Trichonephila clavipes]
MMQKKWVPVILMDEVESDQAREEPEEIMDINHDSGTTRGLLATDHVILNHCQVTWMTPELTPPLLTTTPHQREEASALDRFRCIVALHGGSLVVLGSKS